MHAERTLSLPARTADDADPAVAGSLRSAATRTGTIPNMYTRMANVPGLLDTYLFGYRKFLTGSAFTNVEQQVVLLTISRVSGCNYCVAAHSALADSAGADAAVTEAIRDRRPVPDPKLATLAEFTETMVSTRGIPSATAMDSFFNAGYTETDVLQIVLAISVKTVSNYTNHLFHTPVDEHFAYRAWED